MASLGGLVGGLGGGSVVGQAVVQVVGDTAQLQKDFRSAEAQAKTSAGRMAGSMNRFGITTQQVMLAGGVAIAAFVAKGIKELALLDAAQKQTEARIKSTGGLANVTAGQVRNMSASLEELTSVDEVLIQKGANMLLTFTNIRNEVGKGNDIFNQATKTLLDLSVAMGTDPQRAAIQLGKALQDPVRGITALRRVGVAFTAEQQDQIKVLVESGKVMEAQKMILHELSVEFGGSAEALGTSVQGQWALFLDSVSDLAREMARSLLPTLLQITRAGTDLFKMLMPLAPLLDDVLRAFLAYKVLGFLGGQITKFGTAARLAGTNVFYGGQMMSKAGTAAAAFGRALPLAGTAAAVLIPIIGDLTAGMNAAKDGFEDWVESIESEGENLRLPDDLGTAFESAFAFREPGAIQTAIRDFRQFKGEFIGVMDILHKVPDRAAEVQESIATIGDGFIAAGGTAKEFITLLNENMAEFTEIIHFQGPEAALDWLARLAGVSREGGIAVAEVNERLNLLKDATKGLGGEMELLATVTGQSMGDLSGAIATALEEGEKGIEEWTTETVASIHEWRDQMAEGLNGLPGALEELAQKSHVSADRIIASFRRQLEVMSEYADNWRAVSERGGVAAEGLLQHISSMGLEGAALLAGLRDANRRDFNEIIDLWNKGGRQSESMADSITETLLPALQVLIDSVREAGGLDPINLEAELDMSQVQGEMAEFNERMKRMGVSVRMTPMTGPGREHFAGQAHSGGRIPGDLAARSVGRPLRANEVPIVAEKDEFVTRAAKSRQWAPVLEAINEGKALDPRHYPLLDRLGVNWGEYHVGGGVKVKGKGAGDSIAQYPEWLDSGVATVRPSVDLSGLGTFRLGDDKDIKGASTSGLNSKAMFALRAVTGTFPWTGLLSGLRPGSIVHGTGTPSQHGFGNAIDVSTLDYMGIPDRDPEHGALKDLWQIWDWSQQYRSRLALDFSVLSAEGRAPIQYSGGGTSTPSSTNIADHWNHQHMDFLHKGGIVPHPWHHTTKGKEAAAAKREERKNAVPVMQTQWEALNRWLEFIGVDDGPLDITRMFLARMIHGGEAVGPQMRTWAYTLPDETVGKYELAAFGDWLSTAGSESVLATLVQEQLAYAAFMAMAEGAKKAKGKAKAEGKGGPGDRIEELLQRSQWPQTQEAQRDAIIIARHLAEKRGWTPYWDDLQSLWSNESGFRWWADNPSSEAYGIPQANPGSKMARVGSDYRRNIWTQEKWGLGYIDERYGDPRKAWAYWQANHAYHAGGPVVGLASSGVVTGPMLAALSETGAKEAVWNLSDPRAGRAIVEAIERVMADRGNSAGGPTIVVQFNKDVYGLPDFQEAVVGALQTAADRY